MPPLHPLHRQLYIGVCGEEHHFEFGETAFQLSEPVEPLVAGVDVGVEVHVQQHGVGPELLHRADKGHR